MDLDISEDQFEGALQVLQHGVCRWDVDDFWKLLYEDKDPYGNGHDEKYIDKKFKEWTANPPKFLMGLDTPSRHHLFKKAKESLTAALA